MGATPTSSTIAGVTVYNQGARITRVAKLAAQADGFPGAIRLTGLPLTLRDDSVRVRIEGAGTDSAQLPSALDLKIALEVPELEESLHPADDAEVEAAQAQLAQLVGETRQLERELDRIGQLQLSRRPAGAEGEPPRQSPLDSRLALLDVRQRLEKDLNTELRKKRSEQRAAERHLEDMQEQDRRATRARQAKEHELRKTVIVTLGTPALVEPGARAQVYVDYLVPGARWAPAYAVYFDDALTSAELRMRASVAQDTGEDWSDVPLMLSTADAQGWNELPEMRSIRIGRHQAIASKAGWRAAPTGAEALFHDYDRTFRDRFFGQDDVTPQPMPAKPIPAGSITGEFAVPTASHREDTQPFEPQDADAIAFGSGMAGMPVEEIIEPEPQMFAASMSKKASFAPEPSRRAGRRMMPPPAAAPMPGGISAQQLGADLFSANAMAASTEPDTMRVGDDMLAYASLRMASPRSRRRGSLTIASQSQIYIELLVEQKVEISFDVMAAIARANERANRIGALSLPNHCRFVWSDKYDYAYNTDSVVNIPSDGGLHSVPLTARPGTSTLRYVVVPRHSCDVFRSVEVSNPLDAPLLPGPIDVYKAGDFLLTSKVKFTPPRAKLLLGLGVEQRVKVSRNTRFREDTTGLIKGTLELNHQILIEAINHLSHDIQLEIRERVPTINDGEDDIKVNVKEVEPAWEAWDPFPEKASSNKLKGGYRWRTTLGANDKRTFKVAYEVRISSKHQLVGGNRREV